MAENRKAEEIKVREMTKSDLAKINAIDNSLRGQKRVTTWPFTFDTYWRIYEPELGFVAEINHEVVGVVAGVIETEERSKYLISQPRTTKNPGQTSPKIGWIEMMGVHSDHWGKGVGQAMMEAFTAECKKNKAATRIIVRDNDENLKRFLVERGFDKSEFITYERPV